MCVCVCAVAKNVDLGFRISGFSPVTLEKSLKSFKLSEFQYHHLKNGDNIFYLMGSLS